MSDDLFVPEIPEEAPVAVILVEQEGCPACADFHPVFVEHAQPYAAEGLPIIRLDAGSTDPTAQAFMAKHGVRVTPTLLLVPRWAYAVKLEGPQDSASLRQALDWALGLHRPRQPWWQ